MTELWGGGQLGPQDFSDAMLGLILHLTGRSLPLSYAPQHLASAAARVGSGQQPEAGGTKRGVSGYAFLGGVAEKLRWAWERMQSVHIWPFQAAANA